MKCSIFIAIITVPLLAVGPLPLYGQTDSYQTTLDSLGVFFNDVAVDAADKKLLFMRISPLITNEQVLYAIRMEDVSGVNSGFQINTSSGTVLNFVNKINYANNRLVFNATGHTGTDPSYQVIGSIDMVSGENWARKLITNIGGVFRPFYQYENGDILFVGYADDQVYPIIRIIEFHKLDAFGNIIFKKGFHFKALQQVGGDEIVYIYQVSVDWNGNIYLLGAYGLWSQNDPENTEIHFLAKFDSVGNPMALKTLEVPFNEITFTSTGPLLLNYADSEPFYYNYRLASANAYLVQLDRDLNFIWGKEYYGENFPYHLASVKKMPDGNLLMAHVTKGAFPVVLTRLDSTGNILSQKGYPNYEPDIDILSDGSILMSSPFSADADGNRFRKVVLAKTDTAGYIEGCDTFPACIQSKDFSLSFGTFEVEPYDIYDLEDFTLQVTPVGFSFTEGCNFPPAPVPGFHFPDTLCLGDSARTADTHNRLANARGWHLSGPGVDSVQMDSFDFGYRFLEAGEYRLQHTVWVLGCGYRFEKNVTVLPELEIDITPEYICPDGPFEIGVFSNRAIKNYLWENGQTSELLNVTAPGTYSVQASDGHCTATDTAEIFFVLELLGNGPPVGLPPDTTVCEIHLPFPLKITSDFTDTFFVDDNFVSNNEYTVNSSGEYLVETNIYGCDFSKTFTLHASDCRAAIYVPNVFSPNGDGINDEFYPQGNDFEIISLRVYDRWGGLRYKGMGSGARWLPDWAVGQGSYLYLLVYKNEWTGEEETLAGDVVLVR